MSDHVVLGGNGPDPRPPEAEIAEAAHALGFSLQPDAAIAGGLQGLLEMWQEMAVNGGAFTASFAISGVAPAAEWCFRTARLGQLDLPRRLLASTAMTEALPDHRTDPVMLRQAPLADLHPLQLEGDLALTLIGGGAHRPFPGTIQQAKAIAADAAVDLIGDRYDEFAITVVRDGWAPWFGWVAWDRTWIITDLRTHSVRVVALTDTD